MKNRTFKQVQTFTQSHTFEHIHLVQKMSYAQQNVYKFFNNVQNLCLKKSRLVMV